MFKAKGHKVKSKAKSTIKFKVKSKRRTNKVKVLGQRPWGKREVEINSVQPRLNLYSLGLKVYIFSPFLILFFLYILHITLQALATLQLNQRPFDL